MNSFINLIINQIDEARIKFNEKKGTLVYFMMNDDNVYEIHYINVSYLKKDRANLIKELKGIENKSGFLFWANTPVGERFYYENYNEIVDAFNNSTKKPWLDNGYLIIKKK